MTRRVVYHQGRSLENEELIIITVFESKLNKSEVKKLMPYSKKHDVLVNAVILMTISKKTYKYPLSIVLQIG